MVVRRRVLNLNEIATWFDRLTMSGCAPRNDGGVVGVRRNDKVGTLSRRRANELRHPANHDLGGKRIPCAKIANDMELNSPDG